MIEPVRAAVRPRVISPETGDAVLLEDEVADWLKSRSRRLGIVGGPGSGKTTARQHLAAVFGPVEGVQWLDDPDAVDFVTLGRTVYVRTSPLGEPECALLTLAPWSDDELLEYCLKRYPEKCSSILRRCQGMPDRDRLEGVPALWAIVLEALATDEAVSDWRRIFADRLSSVLPDTLTRPARAYCLGVSLDYKDTAERALRTLSRAGWNLDRLPWLGHRAVQMSFAAIEVLARLEENGHIFFLSKKWPTELLDETANVLSGSVAAAHRLVDVVERKFEQYHATAASLLHAMNRGWQPPQRTRARLTGAVFRGASWPGINLSKAKLDDVDLSFANLTAANLHAVTASRISLRRASLQKSNLSKAKLSNAVFSQADVAGALANQSDCRGADFQDANLCRVNFFKAELQGADFTGAICIETDFTGSSLSRATLTGADLSRADLRHAQLAHVRLCETTLSGARLAGASMVEADLEGVNYPGGDFENVDLTGAYLTGSFMPQANFRGAKLCRAGLADVSWEGADLRDADFTNCAFHLGSSRSGLVGSPIACEGSRTGFYTDDFLEQDFKSPEEIRKADLRGADLRGALVHNADFYLVDLRGARYTSDQADHFRRCGAILVDRVQRT
jgi:uncharacterized protein YjbI with pentapeptide repeats